MLLCDRYDVPIHAHCVDPPFTGRLGNYWSCRDCTEDQAAVSEGHESEGTADFTIDPRDWPGTYLEWLNEDLRHLIFGPLQLRAALEWVRFRVACRVSRYPDHVPSAKDLVEVCADVTDPQYEHWLARYFVPTKAALVPKTSRQYFGDGIFVSEHLTAAHVAKYRDSTDRKRRAKYKRLQYEAFGQLQWFSDALLRSRGMEALPNWFPRRRVDYAQICDGCGGKPIYDWENRAKWPSSRWGAVWMERLGLSFELPQQRWLGDDNRAAEYGTEMHTLHAAEGRARTTDLLDAREARLLRWDTRTEWGRKYADSFQSRRAPGTLCGYVTADGVAHADARAARNHELKLKRDAVATAAGCVGIKRRHE